MFRLPGADRTPDKTAVEEERRRAKQNVWFTMKAFVAYVVLLRLGKVTFYVDWCCSGANILGNMLTPENGHKCW